MKILFLALMLQLNCLLASAHEIPLFRRFIIWPNFCLEHLHKDPEGCSSWKWDSKNSDVKDNYYGVDEYLSDLCFTDDYYFERSFDEFFCHFIPTTNKYECDHAICTKCNSSILREYHCSHCEKDSPFITYWCKCCERPLDIKKGCDTAITKYWKFCKKPSVWSGYFQKYNHHFYHHFTDLLWFSDRNRACKCYWPEKSLKLRKILDEIFLAFLRSEVKSPDISDSTIHAILNENRNRFGIIAIENLCSQLAHSFSYTQIKEALITLDPEVSCWFHHRPYFDKDHGDNNSFELDVKGFTAHLQFCEELLKRIRPLFLELHQECYNKHPHPRIAKEIEVLLGDMK